MATDCLPKQKRKTIILDNPVSTEDLKAIAAAVGSLSPAQREFAQLFLPDNRPIQRRDLPGADPEGLMLKINKFFRKYGNPSVGIYGPPVRAGSGEAHFQPVCFRKARWT